MTRTVADGLVELLESAGVDRIFGLVGDSLNPIVDAVRRSGRIEWVHVYNEESAAFAASAYASLTGNVAVCAASCGPGNTHLLQGLYDAQRNAAPVFAIATHIPSTEVGMGYFQETHPGRVFTDCSVYCEVATGPENALRQAHIALQAAISSPGVGMYIVSGDISAQEAPDTWVKGALSVRRPTIVPHPDDVSHMATLINSATKPMLFCGAGVKDAREEVLALAQRIKAPIGHAFGGKDIIQYDNPFDVGMNGLLGYGACYDAKQEADLIILLGTNFPYTEYFPSGTAVIQVDSQASQLGSKVPLQLGVHAEVKPTIEALLPLVEEKHSEKFLHRMLKKHEKLLRKSVDKYTKNAEKFTPIHPEYLAYMLDDIADEKAIFTVDTGMCNVWAARYLTPAPERKVFGSWRHGSMANALPHAIGAAYAFPDHQIITFSGDGGLSMLMGELLTVKHHNLPIKIVVFNNAELGMISLEMMVAGLPPYQTRHSQFDYAKIAQGVGIPAVHITDPHTLESQLREALASPGPMLIDVETDPQALSMPPKITYEQMSGFAKAGSKILLEGGIGKMYSLAKSNIRNIPGI